MTLFSVESTVAGAFLSDDGKYRYELWRSWDISVESLTFVMLNPSTADANIDDPTIRRCIRFAKDHGFGGIRVLNLYAFRATNPKDMFRATDPVGPLNDSFFDTGVGPVIVAWGAHARADRVRKVLPHLVGRQLFHLGLTKDGAPRHPLYVRADQPFRDFKAAS